MTNHNGNGRANWRGLAFVALGVSMIMLDTTIVNVSLPWMAFDLGFTTSDTQWVVAAYSLTFASLLILAGRLADLFGRRLLFVIGTSVFVAASMLIGVSNSVGTVIAGRALQGMGGAIIMPTSLALINASFSGRNRTTAFAVWGGTIGGMAALGPLVGGWLTTYATWHWAFFVNLPICLVVIFGARATMPESRDDEAGSGFDIPGVVLSTLGLAGIVFALIEGSHYGWITQLREFSIGSLTWTAGHMSIALLAAIEGALCLIAFVVVERQRAASGKALLLDLRLFAIRSFRMGNIVAVIVSLGEFGLLFVLPLFVQGVLGYDPMQTGVLLLALAAGSFLASGAGARLAMRTGAVRVLQLGMLLEAIGIAGIGLALSTHATRLVLAPELFLYGLGIGFATAQLTGVILREVPVHVSGQASAVQSTSRQVGAAIGTAILGAMLSVATVHSVTAELLARGASAAKASEFAEFVTNTSGQMIQFLILQPNGKAMVAGAHEGFATATQIVAAGATAFVVLGLIASLRLPRDTDSSH